MEADLARYYPGTHLVDVWRPGGGLTYRRVMNLIKWLPDDAATWAALGRRTLTLDQELIATIWESLAEQLHPARPGPVHDPDAKSQGADVVSRLKAHKARYNIPSRRSS